MIHFKDNKMVIECEDTNHEYWLSLRKAIIESMEAQNSDWDCKDSNFDLLELLLYLEPTEAQAKQLFKQ